MINNMNFNIINIKFIYKYLLLLLLIVIKSI